MATSATSFSCTHATSLHTITRVYIRESQTQLLAINFASPVAPGFESPDPVPARLPVVGEGLVEDGLLVLHKTHQQ